MVSLASTVCLAMLVLWVGLAPTAATAAEAEAQAGGFVIEEVVVTARKREESLQETPIAVTAFTEEEIDQVYGNDIGEFSKYTPNVILARQPYAGNALFGGIRGIVFGDLEKSFDPAVGVVVDGVPLVTNTSALIDNFDLESIEILRGPQGTLFGRNTIAGVVNVRRTRPTKEFGVKTQLRYGSYNEQDYKAIVNFGNGDTFGVKLGAFVDKSDGFQEEASFDLATGAINGSNHQIDGEDTFNGIASVLWEPNDKFNALFTFEYTDDDSTLPTPTNLTTPNLDLDTWNAITGQLFADLGAGVPPPAAIGTAIGTTFALGGNFCDLHGTTIAPLQPPPNTWVRDIACASQGYLRGETNGYKYSYSAQPFLNKIERKSYTLELGYSLNDSLTLTSITNYQESDELLDEDNLGTPIDIFNPYRPQDYDQFSTELRIESSFDGPLNVQAGIYYVESEYEITQSIWALGSFAGTREQGVPPSPDGDAGQESTSYALFGEAYYDLTDKARLTVGARWTYDEKEFWIYQRSSGDTSGLLPPTVWGCGNLSSRQRATADAVATAWIAAAPNEEAADARAAALVCNDDGDEDWTEFTPRVAIDYRFTDEIMAYASYARGFRSGGWNGRATTPGSIGPYDPETVDSYELGLRSDLFDNTLRLNLTGYFTEYEDKQESEIYEFGFATETIVNNAAKAEIKGVELEAQWVPTDRLQVRLAVGRVDGEYKEFLANNRLTGEREDISDIFEFGFAPEWNYNVGVDYFQPLGGDLGTAIYRTNYAWADGTVGNFGQPDPQGLGRNEFDDRGEWDFSVIWQNPWVDVTAFVKDAFHEDNYLATSVDVGVFWFGALAPGRTFGIELTKTW